MNNLLKELIYEILMIKENKPPKSLKTGSILFCKIKNCENNRLKNKVNKDEIKVKVKVPDSKGPFSEIEYPLNSNTTYRVLTKSLKKIK